VRIIGGKYRGRKIIPPSNFRARPTTDFAREGLFNILANRVDFEDISVLDLFAGTGCISYEFASRGVKIVHSVEMDRVHVSGIAKIIRELGMDNVRPLHVDMRAYVKTCTAKYDIVFADPPYDLPWFDEVPDLVTGSGIIADNGFFVLEHPKNKSYVSHSCFFEHRNYGGVNFSFFRRKDG
jgi:16S rRNA (guanine(966)-N(2))-methyltransferase RsmD